MFMQMLENMQNMQNTLLQIWCVQYTKYAKYTTLKIWKCKYADYGKHAIMQNEKYAYFGKYKDKADFNTSLYSLLRVSWGQPQSSGDKKRMNTKWQKRRYRQLNYPGAFTFSTFERRDMAICRQWFPTSCLELREAISGFLRM